MLKVLKNLKNSWSSVIVIVILLCIQATADLALPDYTSKIVNIGIQSGGIETAVPKIISKEYMENLLIFTRDDEKILENYELVGEQASLHQKKILEKYLGKDYNYEENKVYVLKELDEESLNKLTEIITEPLLEYTSIIDEETASKIKSQMMQNISKKQNKETILQNESNMTLIDLLKQIPDEQRDEILEKPMSYIAQMSDSIKEQATIGAVKQI